MEKVRYGIVGVGNMGSAHSRNLMEGKVEEAVLGAVCDIDPAKIAAFKEKYPEIPTFDCAEDMYKSGLIDAVVVAIPHYDHPRYAVEGLDKYTSIASGLFMVMVCGGGIVPLVQGAVADAAGYISSYWVLVAALAFIFWFGLSGSKVKKA